jgi:hypothetical protein
MTVSPDGGKEAGSRPGTIVVFRSRTPFSPPAEY